MSIEIKYGVLRKANVITEQILSASQPTVSPAVSPFERQLKELDPALLVECCTLVKVSICFGKPLAHSVHKTCCPLC